MAYYRGKTFMEIANTYEIDTGLIPDDGSGGTTAIPDGGDNGGLPENYPFERTTSNGEGSTASPIPTPPAGRICPPCRRYVRSCGI